MILILRFVKIFGIVGLITLFYQNCGRFHATDYSSSLSEVVATTDPSAGPEDFSNLYAAEQKLSSRPSDPGSKEEAQGDQRVCVIQNSQQHFLNRIDPMTRAQCVSLCERLNGVSCQWGLEKVRI